MNRGSNLKKILNSNFFIQTEINQSKINECVGDDLLK